MQMSYLARLAAFATSAFDQNSPALSLMMPF